MQASRPVPPCSHSTPAAHLQAGRMPGAGASAPLAAAGASPVPAAPPAAPWQMHGPPCLHASGCAGAAAPPCCPAPAAKGRRGRGGGRVACDASGNDTACLLAGSSSCRPAGQPARHLPHDCKGFRAALPPPTLTGTLVSTSRIRFMESRMLARCMRSAVWICIADMKFCQSDALSPHSQGNLGQQGGGGRRWAGAGRGCQLPREDASRPFRLHAHCNLHPNFSSSPSPPTPPCLLVAARHALAAGRRPLSGVHPAPPLLAAPNSNVLALRQQLRAAIGQRPGGAAVLQHVACRLTPLLALGHASTGHQQALSSKLRRSGCVRRTGLRQLKRTERYSSAGTHHRLVLSTCAQRQHCNAAVSTTTAGKTRPSSRAPPTIIWADLYTSAPRTAASAACVSSSPARTSSGVRCCSAAVACSVQACRQGGQPSRRRWWVGQHCGAQLLVDMYA